MYLPTNRRQSKLIAIALIVIGVLLLPDIIAPTPGADLINLAISMPLADILQVEYMEAVMITFGVGGLLVILGFLVYPYSTKRLINGRATAAYHFIIANPFIALLAVGIFLLLFHFSSVFYDTYYEGLKGYVEVLIAGG